MHQELKHVANSCCFQSASLSNMLYGIPSSVKRNMKGAHYCIWNLNVTMSKFHKINSYLGCSQFLRGSLKGRFLTKNQHTKRNFLFKNCLMKYALSKKCQNCTFIVNFLLSKINRFFSKKNSFQNINSGGHFLVKTLFLDWIFEPLFFLKLGPFFDELTLPVGIF